MEYEIEELENGTIVFVSRDGRMVDTAVVEMMFELHRQNPTFYEHWVELARNYVFSGASVVEA